MKIYTKTGDKGTTSLVGGSRVKKDDCRVWAYGTIDEANSALGLARSHINDEKIRKIIFNIQKDLFEVGAELAAIGTEKYKERINSGYVTSLEEIIDKIQEEKPEFFCFMVPGGTVESAFLDVARTTIRKAERYISEVRSEYYIGENLVRYINRLSDCIYAIARYIDFKDIKDKVKMRFQVEKKHESAFSVLNIENAELIAKASISKAHEIHVPMVICITDPYGNMILLKKMDGALIASIEIAKGKAYTSAVLKMATDKLKDLSLPQGELWGIGNLPNIVTFGGGYPLIIKDKIAGAIGVSGGAVDEDMKVALAGVEVLKEDG